MTWIKSTLFIIYAAENT